jgi:transposase InsO family protein
MWLGGFDRKKTEIVLTTLSNFKIDFDEVKMFHSDRGLEFTNKEIEAFLVEYNILNCLSEPCTPLDNALLKPFIRC